MRLSNDLPPPKRNRVEAIGASARGFHASGGRAAGTASRARGNIAVNLSAPLTPVLRRACWWNSAQESPDDVTKEAVRIELNTGFSTKGRSSPESQAIVAAWQAGAISRETMLDLLRRGEVRPEGRTKEEEEELGGGQVGVTEAFPLAVGARLKLLARASQRIRGPPGAGKGIPPFRAVRAQCQKDAESDPRRGDAKWEQGCRGQVGDVLGGGCGPAIFLIGRPSTL